MASPRRIVNAPPGVPPGRTRLSVRRYAFLTGAGLALTGLQLLLLPRALTARDFGLVVLSISVTQAVIQLGDLGLSRACVDRTRSGAEQAEIRAQAQALNIAVTGLILLGVLAFHLWSRGDGAVPAALALGAAAAIVVTGEKYRAAAREVRGDEIGSATHNFVWSNTPKVGMLAALLLTRNPFWILAASVGVGAACCRPYATPLRLAWRGLRAHRVWGYTLIATASAFVITWADTYFLTARLGLAGAGSYEAMYRVLSVCSYVYLPWGSVIVNRINARERRPLVRPLILAVALTGLSIAGASLFLARWAPAVFPNLSLPLAALPSVAVFFLLASVSYTVGSGLYARGHTGIPVVANTLAVVIVIAGHIIFTLHGGAVAAATVSAVAMGVSVVILAGGYWRNTREPSR